MYIEHWTTSASKKEGVYAYAVMCDCITAGGLQRMASFLTPSYRMQIRAISIHPVIVFITPTIKMDLK